ncbi:MAG: hypothetical protein ABSH53_17585 [Holophaga sp.]
MIGFSPEVAMASIQVPPLLAKAYRIDVFPAPKPAQTPAPQSTAQAPATDTVTISAAGLAASQNYLQSMLQLYQSTDQQLTLLAQDGNTLAQELLSQRQAEAKLFALNP